MKPDEIMEEAVAEKQSHLFKPTLPIETVYVCDAAEDKFNAQNLQPFFNGKGELYAYKEGSKFGANWQKQQDEALRQSHKELVEVLELFMSEYTDVNANTPIAFYKVVKAAKQALTKAKTIQP